jgi:peptidoglycan hydrolase CwlO-like protein
VVKDDLKQLADQLQELELEQQFANGQIQDLAWQVEDLKHELRTRRLSEDIKRLEERVRER